MLLYNLMKGNNFNKKQPYFYALGLIAFLMIVLGIFYKNSQYGTLQIKSSEENLTIFIDNQRAEPQQEIDPQFKLKKGQHTIVVAKDKFWPWMKEVEIEENINKTIQPFFIPQNTSGVLIGEVDPEYSQIMSLFQNNLISTSTLISIPKENALLKETAVALDFYKDRQDVVVIASGDGIYALEIDSQNIQNFQPIYKGVHPLFVKKDNLTLYVLDNNNLMLVNY